MAKKHFLFSTDSYHPQSKILCTPTPSSKLTVYHDTGSGKHRQLINHSDLAVSFGEVYCVTLLGLYVLSVEDFTSAFKGKGRWAPEQAGEETQVS